MSLSNKVPANGLPNLVSTCLKGGYFSPLTIPEQDVPHRCVLTCEDFPKIKGMKTKPKDPPPVLANEKIEYECNNKNKVPNTPPDLTYFVKCELDSGKFEPEPVGGYPECVIACVSHPEKEGFKPSHTKKMEVKTTVNYTCETEGYKTHTGEDLIMYCTEEGVLEPHKDYEEPKCVKADTCRKEHFPKHPDYEVADSSILYYNKGEV